MQVYWVLVSVTKKRGAKVKAWRMNNILDVLWEVSPSKVTVEHCHGGMSHMGMYGEIS